MKKIQLTQNKSTLVNDEDFEKLNKYNWHTKKGKCTYYAVRTDNKLKITIYMHRVIMNPQSNLQVDHRNSNGLDNQKENLRICTQSQNNCNRRLSKNNTSGTKGVCWRKRNKKWVAHIKMNGKSIHLGSFDNEKDAKNIRTKTSKKYFGEFHSD